MTDLYADNGYLDHYQFKHDPFLARGPSFKFFAAKRRPVLVELHHLARYSKLMLVVTGPQGSGKTVLRQALVASSKEPIKSIVITASGKADAASMLQKVSAELGLLNSDIAGVLRHIEQLLITGQEVHVIVDNAECLDDSALLFLQRIAQGVNDSSARVFVFSDSSICPLLEKVADSADLHHVVALEAWDEQETLEYIEQRLIAAGQDLDIFTEPQLEAIYTQSRGWPGQVNTVAKALLLEKMTQISTKRTPVKLPYKHLALLAVLGIGLAAAWFMQTNSADSTGKNVDVATSEQPLVLPVEPVPVQHGTKIEVPLELTPEPVLREPLAQAVNSDDDDVAVEPLDAEVKPEPVAAVPVSAPPVAVSAPVPVSRPPSEIIKQTVVPATPLVEKKPAAAVKAKPAAPAAVAKNKAPTGLAGSAGHSQWFKQQTPSRYTLQVLGTRSEATARSFVQQNPSQYHYFRKEHQGQALFVVTYGAFTDRAAAQTAINSLPEKIRKDKPWPRTILSIQQELR